MSVLKVIPRFLLSLLLTVLLFLGVYFLSFYIKINVEKFSLFTFSKYVSGYTKILVIFWGIIEFLIFLTIEILLFTELLLWIFRLNARNIIKILDNMTGKKHSPKIINKISTITLFKLMGINTIKRGLIFGFSYIGVLYLSQFLLGRDFFLGKTLIYRTYQQTSPTRVESLHTDTEEIELKNKLIPNDTLKISIQGGNCFVYVDYRANQTYTGLVLEYNYDTDTQKNWYSYTFDDTTGELNVIIDNHDYVYQRYVDDLIPTIRVLVPKTHSVGRLEVEVDKSGYVMVGEFEVSREEYKVVNSTLSFNNSKKSITNLSITANSSKISGDLALVENCIIDLTDTEMILNKAVIKSLDLKSNNSSVDFLNVSSGELLTINSKESTIRFTNVVFNDGEINLEKTILTYSNSKKDKVSYSFIVDKESKLSLKNVERK